jgi:glycerophosphoryl diester phosphodiesterase
MAYASGSGGGPVEIIGHRGSPRRHRENTLPSFRQAFADGARAVELDVHGTTDGAVVVHHDHATNSRVADSGPVLVLARSTLAELRSVPIGGERIPTLNEVLATTPLDTTVYVEVKANGIDEPVVAAIRSSGRPHAVHSFDHRIVRNIHRLAPEIPVGILQTSYPIDPIRPLLDAGARDLWQQWELIDESLIERVQRHGGRVIAWTVNDPAVAERLAGWGVDGICSDIPGDMAFLAARPSR